MSKLSELNVCSKDEFVATLANVFEYSPWIAEQAAALRPFAGVNELFAAMRSVVDRARDSGMTMISAASAAAAASFRSRGPAQQFQAARRRDGTRGVRRRCPDRR